MICAGLISPAFFLKMHSKRKIVKKKIKLKIRIYYEMQNRASKKSFIFIITNIYQNKNLS